MEGLTIDIDGCDKSDYREQWHYASNQCCHHQKERSRALIKDSSHSSSAKEESGAHAKQPVGWMIISRHLCATWHINEVQACVCKLTEQRTQNSDTCRTSMQSKRLDSVNLQL